MKIEIDTNKINAKKLNINEYLTLLSLYYNSKEESIDYVMGINHVVKLEKIGYVEAVDNYLYKITEKGISIIEGKKRNYDELAEKIRELFPKGKKANKYPWRSSVRDLVPRLKRLDNVHDMKEYDNEEIVACVEKYVNSFTQNDMDAGMQICRYFIEKDGVSALMDNLSVEDDGMDNMIIESFGTKL